MENEKMKETTSRQYDLDWIKVLATLCVFIYHCMMFVNPFPWHIKNSELDSGAILVFSLFVGAWIMPLFFMISGISVFHALKSRDTTSFIKERFVRLGIPLVFGVFILTPPQIYIERITNQQYLGSFLSFIPNYFDGIYLDFGGPGNFAFFGLHLWYLLVLLVFSLITISLLRKYVRLNRIIKGANLILLPLLLFITGFIQTQKIGGWDIVFYLVIFLVGYYFISNPSFKTMIKSTIKFQILIATVTTVVYIVWFMNGLPYPNTVESVIFFAIRTINCWSLLMCIVYLAEKYLRRSNALLKYGSEASMPFYVLHQPVIILVVFFIYEAPWSIITKLSFVMGISFIIILFCYHFIIRRFSVLRVLFGMKKKEVHQVNNYEGKTVV